MRTGLSSCPISSPRGSNVAHAVTRLGLLGRVRRRLNRSVTTGGHAGGLDDDLIRTGRSAGRWRYRPAARRSRYRRLAPSAGGEAWPLLVVAADAGHQMREGTQPVLNRWLLIERGTPLRRATLAG